MAAAADDPRLILFNDQALDLADVYGTPLYVLDEGRLKARARAWLEAWPGEVSYASKANSTLAVLRILAAEGCCIDVASEGELRAALAAGVPAERCTLHGNAKTREEIEFALSERVGSVVADHIDEVRLLAALACQGAVLLRLAPAVRPETYAKISTGQADTKFGMPVDQAMEALRLGLDAGLPIVGFHAHVGSQLLDMAAQVDGARAIASFAIRALDELGYQTRVLNVGGGLGVKYLPHQQPPSVAEVAKLIVNAIEETLDGRLTPSLTVEPGRSMVAEAGVTLYRVVSVKRAGSGRTFVSVDGGLSDNPRPALYGAQYELRWHRPAGIGGLGNTVVVAGKHCESDHLFEDMPAPEDVRPGDLAQVLATGAYNSSMASNYNRYPRPATVLLTEAGHRLVQRRETWDEMFAREVALT